MKTIKFNPTSKLCELSVPHPRPAKEYLPDWYKKIPAFDTKVPEINTQGVANKTLKMCTPFKDGLTSGYIQESWQDIYIDFVENENGDVEMKYSYPTTPRIMSAREKPPYTPVPEEFYPMEFVFHPPWTPELPKGWSMLYSHPFNRIDLPFQFLSAVVDNDSFTWSREESNMPFYVKKSFSGVIPKGTPLYQMTPIKREHWETEISKHDPEKQIKIVFKSFQHFWGGYKKEYWTKKEYN